MWPTPSSGFLGKFSDFPPTPPACFRNLYVLVEGDQFLLERSSELIWSTVKAGKLVPLVA